MPKNPEQWEVDSAVNDLIRAEEIKNDKKLFPKVKTAFAAKMAAMQDAALELKIARKQTVIRARKD